MKNLLLLGGLLVAVVSTQAQSQPGDVQGTGLSFLPDFSFSGSSLDGWHKIGQADWRAQDSEIIGTVKPGAAGGLLVLDRTFQDIVVHSLFQITGESEAGLVLRLEKTEDGLKGVLVSIKDGELISRAVVFDKDGKEVKRDTLRSIGSYPLVRQAPPGTTNAPAGGGGSRSGGRRNADTDLVTPYKRPNTSYRAGEWNQIEVYLDLNIVRCFLNDGGPSAVGAADESVGRFGPVALYAGGPGEFRFKDFKYKDFSARVVPEEKVSQHFRVQRINDMYYSWGAGAADFNKDGRMDVVAGPYIYFGPEFTRCREIYPAIAFNPSKEFTEVNCQYGFDYTGDGWPDVLTGPPNATLYVNPRGESRRWDKHVVVPSVQSEVTVLRDIDGSGVPALIYCSGGTVRYAKPDPADATKPWIQRSVSERGYAMGHGLGAGDINGDGRVDLLNPNGWWEQPADLRSEAPWKYHPAAFARYGHRSSGIGGAVMAVFDANGDGWNDVVGSLNAHGFGLAWFEQKRDAQGEITFARHMISDDYAYENVGGVTFSEPHGSTFADINNDGIPDFIVGKRYWSHLDSTFDPDPYGDPVVYCYRTVRNPKAPGGAQFVPELIHNRSGVGSDVLAADLNQDGLTDVVTSTDRGTFIFWNTSGSKLR